MFALSRDLDVDDKTAFVLAHKLREAMAEEMKGRTIGGEGKVAEIDAGWFGGYVKPANLKSHYHIASAYLLRYAQEASWREDNRRVSNGDQMRRLTKLATMKKTSPNFVGYWQRHQAAR